MVSKRCISLPKSLRSPSSDDRPTGLARRSRQAIGGFVLAALLTLAASPLAQAGEPSAPNKAAPPVWSPERPASSWKIPSVRVSTSADTNRSAPRVRISSLQDTGSSGSKTTASCSQ